MIADDNARCLVACLMPPGPAHIHAVRSMAFSTNLETVMNAGFWGSLVLDYLLRITGTRHLDVTGARLMPAASVVHPLAQPLLLRTLRLNCLTKAYAGLWRELYSPRWQTEAWVRKWPAAQPLGQVGGDWTWDTPLRTEYARRAALVEIDAVVAVWLGFDMDELLAAYESRFGVLVGYEEEMYFDANGCQIAANHNAYGLGQTKEHWQQFENYLEDPAANPPPDGYEPPFYKADRIAEYRQAHAVFERRLQEARDKQP